MAGTLAGGRKAAQTNKERHGADYYSKIGSIGGKMSDNGGFWHAKYVKGDEEHAKRAGRLGGQNSRRKKQCP